MSLPAPFDAFVAPARRRPALWRLALGVVAVAGIWLGAVVAALLPAYLASEIPEGDAWADRVIEGDDPVAVLAMLATFAGPFAGVLLVARLLHGRAPGTLVGPARRAARDFARMAVVVAGAYAVSLALWGLAFDSVPGLAPGAWLLALPAALALLALQTGAEELIFRGYLQTQLAARFASPVAWLVLPSLAFGAIHWDPDMGTGNALAVVGVTGLFGLVAADLTARTGTLGAAWGLHFANNVVAILVLATPGALPGLALRLTPYDAADPILGPLLVADAATLVLVWLIGRRVLGAPQVRVEAGAGVAPRPPRPRDCQGPRGILSGPGGRKGAG